jgi:hypothetical protein
MPETVQMAKCDFCGKTYARWNAAVKHEKICYYNPERRACATCANMVAKDHGYYDDEHEQRVPIFVPECDIELDVVEDTKERHEYKSDCPGWELRTATGTVKFGRTRIEKV